MELIELLKQLNIFDGLPTDKYVKVAKLCSRINFPKGSLIAAQGTSGEDFFIIADGFVEVSVQNQSQTQSRVLVNLGPGQLIGEMAIVDHGLRSATVRTISEICTVYRIEGAAFEKLCEEDTQIGYIVMRNIASDLSFKLRHQNMQEI
jgi:CRP/FNR family transcriptional regulator, cyclic AMP receptor protein